MMRAAYLPGILLPLALILTAPAGSSADVRVQLRNGSDIIADECQDQGDRYACFKMGGTFEIEKNDIVSIKNVTAGSREIPVTGPQDKTSGSQPDQIKQSDRGEEAAKKSEVGKTQGKPAEPAAPADPLVARALELQAERDRLLKERQQLQEEINNAPTWMQPAQFDDLQRRNAESDEKVKKFNEEAKRLMDEARKRQAEPKK